MEDGLTKSRTFAVVHVDDGVPESDGDSAGEAGGQGQDAPCAALNCAL